jgi:predicted lipoprotein
LLRAAVLAFVVLFAPPRAGTAADLAAAGESLRREVLVPLCAGYDEAARALARVHPDCAGDWRGALRSAFASSLLAWRGLEAAGYGPAAQPERAARVFFWPDKHGTAGRQLGAALRERRPALETAAGLPGQSAGLQSLAALEQLLYPDGAAGDPEADRFACRYALAIADFQARLAAEMAASFASQPQSGAAIAEGLFTGMRTTLDTVIALDLERPLGTDIATARGERARAWRSGLSLPLIAAALGTVERVYTAPAGFASMIRASAELSAFDAVLRSRLQAARQALQAVDVPLHLAVENPAERPRVEALLEELRAVRRLLVERLAPALGFASGFNALDGD